MSISWWVTLCLMQPRSWRISWFPESKNEQLQANSLTCSYISQHVNALHLAIAKGSRKIEILSWLVIAGARVDVSKYPFPPRYVSSLPTKKSCKIIYDLYNVIFFLISRLLIGSETIIRKSMPDYWYNKYIWQTVAYHWVDCDSKCLLTSSCPEKVSGSK